MDEDTVKSDEEDARRQMKGLSAEIRQAAQDAAQPGPLGPVGKRGLP